MTQLTNSVTDERDGSSRARTHPSGECHAVTGVTQQCVTRDVSVQARRDVHAPLKGRDLHAGEASRTLEEKTAAHAQKLAGDPRFAGWVAGMPNAPAERVELTRRCAVRIIENHAAGRTVDRHNLRWATDFVAANPKLDGPLSTGEPA